MRDSQLLCAGLARAIVTIVIVLTTAQSAMAQRLAPEPNIFPPWQSGKNNDSADRGVDFTVAQIDDLADFHGDLSDLKLVLYVGGNYFFAMAPLVLTFDASHPDFKGRIYWETIPPGLLVEHIEAGGRITSGSLTWTVKADAYFAGLSAVNALIAEGLLRGPAVPYVTNKLAIMVSKDNPKEIATLADLARPDLRLALPDPAFEGVAQQVETSLGKAGGEPLTRALYETKVAGSATLTRIHHRQTPFVKGQKNDYNDAEAIAEASLRPNLRTVREKTQDQLDLQACHRVRSRLVSRRTATINQNRAFLIGQALRLGRERPLCATRSWQF
jgi:Bacterial extracellular solute-binding protein/Transposase